MMTLEQFRATLRVVPFAETRDDLKELYTEDHPVSVFEYAGPDGFTIERMRDGNFHLILERDIFNSPSLPTLENKLYAFWKEELEASNYTHRLRIAEQVARSLGWYKTRDGGVWRDVADPELPSSASDWLEACELSGITISFEAKG